MYRPKGRILKACMVVAKTPLGRGKGSTSKIFAAALSFSPGYAIAVPDGGQVVTGNASISQSGATTTINQTSQNLSLKWTSFDIAPTETVNFVQPSASSIAVNRIIDTNGTQILGRLNANGQVYLINPNGILFGQGAQVNVGALVASTLDFDDDKLNDPSITFSGNGTGSIVNQGGINTTGLGGYVALLGNTVSNQGDITAPQGTVALGAGSSTTLTFENNSLIKMQVDQSVLNTLAENGGLIRADGGMVLMNAGAKDALLASVVNNTGVIEAHTVQEHNGTIILLGGMTAGTVNVDGTLDASAPNGGNGGFIETSAARVKIADDVNVTTAAPQGNTGTWLIDPVDFTIASGSAALTTSGIGATTLSNSLIDSSVIIATSDAVGGNGDIFVNSAVSWAKNKLTLSAHRNININADLNASSAASLALEYGLGAVAENNTSQITTTNAAVNLPAGTNNFTTKQGSNGAVKTFTVITSLGAMNSTTTTDLQGMNGGARTDNYALGSNIDATPTTDFGTAGFAPIAGFNGTFDGLGHTVNGLFIDRAATANIGMFGAVGANSVIRNVGLVGGSTKGAAGTGALVGNNGTGTIHNSFATGDVSGDAGTGGLVGSNTTGNISNSFATGDVSGDAGTGGLVGSNTTGNISNSYATGNVSNVAAIGLGGLLGSGSTGNITNSYATGTVTGGAGAGGLVGDITTGNISNSYAIGAVHGGAGSGGLVGRITSGNISNSYSTGSVEGDAGTGGLLGVGTSGIITNSYATGLISGVGAGRGGLIGTTDRTDHVGSFWDINTTGMTTSLGGDGVVGLTTDQMKNPLNFTEATTANGNVNPNWDTASIWTLNSVNYPLLTSLLNKVATVTAENRTETYQGKAYTSGYSVISDNPAYTDSLSGTLSFTGSSQKGVDVGSYDITLGGLFDTNNPQNIVSFVDGTLNITPKALTITGMAASNKTYDGNTVASLTGGSLEGVIAGETLSFTGQTGAFANKNAANGIAVNVTNTRLVNGTGTGLASNYILTKPIVAAANITPKAVTIRGMAASNKIYDGNTVASLTGGSLEGIIAGETLSFAGQTGTFADRRAAKGIAVTVTNTKLVDGKGLASNYSLTQPTVAVANITNKVLNAVRSAVDAASAVYFGTLAAAPVLTVEVQNVITQLTSNILSLVGNPSTTITAIPGPHVSISSGNLGSPLSIINGGIRQLENQLANQTDLN
jgi:filamentous hemagglutinin family protein